MKRQEIIQILDSPSIPDFPALHAMCQDPKGLELVLSLAIAQGEKRGRADVYNMTNRALHEREDRYTGIKSIVGFVML